MLHSYEEVEELLRVMEALSPNRQRMTVGQVDGYVAGLVVCPEAIAPSEWLPAVWGGDGGSALGVIRAAAAARAVRNHYDRVARSLFVDPAEYTPLYETEANSEEPQWDLWIRGFRRAMGLRAGAWERVRLSGDEEAAASVSMIDAMHDIGLGRSSLSGEAVADMERLATDLIPTFVQTLKAWSSWRRPGGGARAGDGSGWKSNVLAFPGPDADLGRPCPCGSRLRYSRCCGSN